MGLSDPGRHHGQHACKRGIDRPGKQPGTSQNALTVFGTLFIWLNRLLAAAIYAGASFRVPGASSKRPGKWSGLSTFRTADFNTQSDQSTFSVEVLRSQRRIRPQRFFLRGRAMPIACLVDTLPLATDLGRGAAVSAALCARHQCQRPARSDLIACSLRRRIAQENLADRKAAATGTGGL